jgi:hypothetical protein
VHAIDHDEGDQLVGAGECVWTGTVAGGTLSANGCNSWTSVSSNNTAMAGDPSSTAQWTSASDKACDSTCRLYCFEQ